jgi:hypothetical protein
MRAAGQPVPVLVSEERRRQTLLAHDALARVLGVLDSASTSLREALFRPDRPHLFEAELARAAAAIARGEALLRAADLSLLRTSAPETAPCSTTDSTATSTSSSPAPAA